MALTVYTSKDNQWREYVEEARGRIWTSRHFMFLSRLISSENLRRTDFSFRSQSSRKTFLRPIPPRRDVVPPTSTLCRSYLTMFRMLPDQPFRSKPVCPFVGCAEKVGGPSS